MQGGGYASKRAQYGNDMGCARLARQFVEDTEGPSGITVQFFFSGEDGISCERTSETGSITRKI